MLNVILVSYYAKYRDKSLKELAKIVKAMGMNAKVIIVNNSNNIYCSPDVYFSFPRKEVQVFEITGSNKSWEFSGWKEALELIGPTKDNEYYMFVNDTFCSHRDWTYLDRYFFTLAFCNHFKSGANGITGDLNSFGEIFSILGYSADSWISTYLFGMNGSHLKEVRKMICMDDEHLGLNVTINEQGAFIFGENVSRNLGRHINGWLNPEDNNKGWYKSKDSSKSLLLKKIKAILNEKMISSFSTSKGGKLYHYIPYKYTLCMRIYKKVRRLLRLYRND